MRIKNIFTIILFACSILLYSQTESKTYEIKKMSTLCKVWGFLKYYHPKIAKGEINWDSVLVSNIPRTKNTHTKLEFNKQIQNILNFVGQIDACQQCKIDSINKSFKNYDFNWMEDTSIFLLSNINDLKFIKENKQSFSNYYVQIDSSIGNTSYRNEKKYKEMLYPSEEYRLLALFRFWNAIQYFYPYKYLIGKDWNNVLDKFIPEFLNANDTAEYHLVVLKLVNSINDGHSNAYNNFYWNYFGRFFSPVELSYIENNTIVTRLYSDSLSKISNLRIGDIILEVNNSPIQEIRKQLLVENASGSNETAKQNYINYDILRGHTDSIFLKIKRQNKIIEFWSKRFLDIIVFDEKLSKKTNQQAWKKMDNNIGYINMGELDSSHVEEAMDKLKHTKAIIFDIRNHPKGTVYLVSDFLNYRQEYFYRKSIPSMDYPGVMIYKLGKKTGPDKPNEQYYKGEKVLLVNESTQSHAEFTCMAFQTAKEVTIIGSQTAGADGNVSIISLPGKIAANYTGVGIHYPNGKEAQRIGIKPDIIVTPTVNGILNGEDEILNAAIKYLNVKFSE